MTIINFPSPPLTEGETYEANGIEYTWDGEKWAGNADKGRDTMVPPVVTGVTLTKTTTGNRFTSQTYNVDPAVTEEGDPASDKFARVKFTHPEGIIEARPLTDEIESVQDTAFADGFGVNSINDNGWRLITWAGEPWNRYIAYGTGSSPENIAYSFDGQTWYRAQAKINGGITSLNDAPVYNKFDQKLHFMQRVKVGSSGYKPEDYACGIDDDWNFTFVSSVSIGGAGADGVHYNWGNLFWSEIDNRWYLSRSFSQNGGTAALVRGPANTGNLSSGWSDLSGIYGYQVGRIAQHSDGSITWAANGQHQNGSASSGRSYAYTSPTSNSTNVNPGSGGYNTTGRWMRVGTVGYAAPTTYANGGGTGGMLNYQLGSSWSTSTTRIDMTNWDQHPELTTANFRDALWIEDLGLGVICGQASTAERTNHGALLTTTDCQNWDLIWTNEPGDDSEYRWTQMIWNTDRQELVLIAESGTNPGFRAGYTQTVGSTIDLPQLKFISAENLAAFSQGMVINERNGDANGIIADVDVSTETMIVKGTTGTWDVGNRVIGPPTKFGDGYGVITGDGNVSGVLPEAGYVQIDSNDEFDLQFPATFVDGTVPDTVLPADTTIAVEYRARSDVNGFIADSNVTSNQITPT